MAIEVNFSSANDGILAGTEQVVAICQGLLPPPCCAAVEQPSPLPLGTAGADKHIRQRPPQPTAPALWQKDPFQGTQHNALLSAAKL